jgi:hypothetical protein
MASLDADTISFEVVEPDSTPGDYGSAEQPSPYINLFDPTSCIANLRNPEEVVIHAPSIRIVADYPFSREFEFEVTPGDGRTEFTRAALARAVADLYQRIYDEEDETAGGPTPNIPGLLNRGRSEGTYGIWGHDLGDLVLHTVHKGHDGRYSLGIDS